MADKEYFRSTFPSFHEDVAAYLSMRHGKWDQVSEDEFNFGNGLQQTVEILEKKDLGRRGYPADRVITNQEYSSLIVYFYDSLRGFLKDAEGEEEQRLYEVAESFSQKLRG